MNTQKGFTLIELLIVIGILAVLATLTVLVLNPAQLFAQARDSQRLNDLSVVNSAIQFYRSTAATPLLGPGSVPIRRSTNGTACGMAAACTQVQVYTVTDQNGWVSIKLNDSAGNTSPVSRLPQDPRNTVPGFFYAYGTDLTDYKLVTNLESDKYVPMEGTDGGTQANFYEIGTNLAL